MLTRLFFITLFCLQVAQASTARRLPTQLPLYISHLPHRLAIDGNPTYYGTAVLFKIFDGQAYFMTNRHLIPETAPGPSVLRINQFLGRTCGLATYFVGGSFGHDIAVIRAEIPTSLLNDAESIKNELLPYAFRSEPVLPNEAVSTGLIGVESAGSKSPIDHNNVPWFTGSDRYRFTPEQRLQALRSMSPDSLAAIMETKTLRRIQECPEYFLSSCYVTNLRSWGYSGGILYTSAHISASPLTHQIIGIVSHYRPLTPETFVIPIDDALKISQKIIDKKGDILDHPSGGFEAINAYALKLTGQGFLSSFVGQIARNNQGFNETIPGGPGDVHGGGPGDVHGGGLAGKDSSADEKLPSTSDRVSSFRPGIVIAGQVYHSALDQTGKRVVIESLGDLVREFSQNPALILDTTFAPDALPSHLQSAAYGLLMPNENDRSNSSVVTDLTMTQNDNRGISIAFKTDLRADSWFRSESISFIGAEWKQLGEGYWVASAEYRSQNSELPQNGIKVSPVIQTSGRAELVLMRKKEEQSFVLRVFFKPTHSKPGTEEQIARHFRERVLSITVK